MADDFVYEVIVTPESGSTGACLNKIIYALNVPKRFVGAVVTDIECNNNRTWVDEAPVWATTQQILEYAASVGQFDWATFFFFVAKPPDHLVNAQYHTLFAEAAFIIRAVDDTFFYVYSPDEGDALHLSVLFPVKYEGKSKDSIRHPF
jgi:hypothetical protein